MSKQDQAIPPEQIYYAKSPNAHHGWILNREHLDKVRRLAGTFGEEIGLRHEAELAGLFHDFGKYSDLFQRVLNGQASRVDHAIAGAAYLYKRAGLYKENTDRNGAMWCTYTPIIEAIRGHHDGLVSLPAMHDQRQLFNILQADMPSEPYMTDKQPALRGEKQFQVARAAFEQDFPAPLPKPRPRSRRPRDYVADMLDTRMLFSCLVDADYTVSAQDDDPQYLEHSSGGRLHADAALHRLELLHTAIRQGSTADTALNTLRDHVYEACGNAASQPMGLFTLTAPTGVGKTLSLLHFALRHCKQYGLQRIIVVLPFLTLAEQTEQTYREVFAESDILVDHSQRELQDEQRALAARWDAPVIITTSVHFFESLFSDRPTDCRKLHHIAESIVLFDEAQSLPATLARPTVEAVQALCEAYHCSMVFSTATQPDFGALPQTNWSPIEIYPNPSSLFAQMRRVRVEWRLYINSARSHMPTISDIAAELSHETNACCLFNLRAHAREMIHRLERLRGTTEGLFLLSTDLCPGHRLAVVDEIKQRQRAGLPCLVVATQCIEAGVDLDFDVMYRALAPLEAIIQAAGRCNRNGRLANGGRVVVFEAQVDRAYPDTEYERAAGIVTELWSDLGDLDINDPELIRTYYRRSFHRSCTDKELQDALSSKNYAEVKKRYRLIRDEGIHLILPWAGCMDRFEAIRATVDRTRCAEPRLLRVAAPFTITCFDRKSIERVATPVCLSHRGECIPTGTYILNRGFERLYHARWGFELESEPLIL